MESSVPLGLTQFGRSLTYFGMNLSYDDLMVTKYSSVSY